MQYGQRPNELVVKKLSMLGCVALVLAHSVKDMQDKLRGYHTGRRSFCFRSARVHTQWNLSAKMTACSATVVLDYA